MELTCYECGKPAVWHGIFTNPNGDLEIVDFCSKDHLHHAMEYLAPVNWVLVVAYSKKEENT